MRTLSWLVLGAWVGAAAACGGPSHDGYKTPTQKPWKNPKVLELDEENEVEIDGSVDYRTRKRARWFAIDLPSFGKLKVRMAVEPFLGDDTSIDLAFEVLDGRYRVIERADRDEEDAGDLSKTRTVEGIDAGRYYVHVFTQERLDRADFDLRLSFEPARKAHESDFPAEVPFVGVLPAVPLFDDAPARPKRRVVRKRPTKKKPKQVSIQGRISGITSTGKGTRIKIDRGSSAGVGKGWRGMVVNSAGKAIQNGSFTVSKVSSSESVGFVRATQDAVTAAKYVRLSPPAE